MKQLKYAYALINRRGFDFFRENIRKGQELSFDL
jgi:hypothetical protein